jgi:anti-anti-sigma factor
MSLFEISVVDAGRGVVRMELEGEIDMSVAPELLDTVLCAAIAHERHNIVLDLQNVYFMDPAGVQALVEADRRLRDETSHLVICNPSTNVLTVLEATGVADQLDVRPCWLASSLTPDSQN